MRLALIYWLCLKSSIRAWTQSVPPAVAGGCMRSKALPRLRRTHPLPQVVLTVSKHGSTLSTRGADARHAFEHTPDNLKRQLRHLALCFLRYFPRSFSKLRRREFFCRSQVRMKTFRHGAASSTSALRAPQRQIRAEINRSLINKSSVTVSTRPQIR